MRLSRRSKLLVLIASVVGLAIAVRYALLWGNATSMHRWAYRGDVDRIVRAKGSGSLDALARSFLVTDWYGFWDQPPLTWAVLGDQPAAITALIETGAKVDGVRENIHSPLSVAIWKRNKACVLELLRHGASMDKVWRGDPSQVENAMWRLLDILNGAELASAALSNASVRAQLKRHDVLPALEKRYADEPGLDELRKLLAE